MLINDLYNNKKQGVAEGKIKLYTDPGYFGAEVDDAGFDSLPIVNISADMLVGFEPDDKMNQPKSRANVEKIVAGLKQGAKLPPLLVRKYKNGYQVLDGHHRFWAYKLLGVKSIPSRIVPDEDIEEISKQGVAEAIGDLGSSRDRGKSIRKWRKQRGLDEQGVAEEASPMIKPPANRFDNKQQAFDHAKQHGGKVFKSTYIDPNTGSKNIVFVVKKDQDMAEEYELAGVGVAYELGRQAYKQGKTIRDNPYSATKEARKYDEWEKGLERGKHDANDAKLFRSRVREQGVEENMNDDELAAMAKKVSPNAYIRVNGQEVQKPENYGRPYTPPPHDAEKHQRDLTAQYPNIDELVAKAEQRRDPDYNYAEGDAYYRGRDAEQNYQKLRQIQRVIQGLNESLNRSHLP
jgi:hypothetical protein